jgi:hypothetical protein
MYIYVEFVNSYVGTPSVHVYMMLEDLDLVLPTSYKHELREFLVIFLDFLLVLLFA